MQRWSAWSRHVVLLSTAVILSAVPILAHAQESARAPRLIIAADPTEQGDGTLSPAAAAALSGRTLPSSAADIAAKAAANRGHAEAAPSETSRSASPSEAAPLAGVAAAKAPTIIGGINFNGLSDATVTPPDTSGSIGPTRYIQLVSQRAGIFNRDTGSPIATGTLNQLADTTPSVRTFHPQVIWDATTNRFYYIAVSVFSASDNRISFGFSKTASPTNLTTAWCKYHIQYGGRFTDYPRLGDSQHFLIIGSNILGNDPQMFFGSDITAISKPAAGTGCPAADSFLLRFRAPLRDPSRAMVFTPVPANQIDSNPTGYVVARERFMPADEFWIFNVVRDSTTGEPIIEDGRRLGVATFAAPPDATQPTFDQLLDTLDARLTQAVQAFNPQRGTFSLWTQHTIAVGARAGVRWYEIDPVPAAPVMLRTDTIAPAGSFAFNASISPDRRVDGATALFGNSVVINYNVSSRTNNVNPRIVAASSVNGGPLQTAVVKGGAGPYRDRSCRRAGDVCRWGDYAGASPDPRPPTSRPLPNRGVVWGTKQYSGVVDPSVNSAQWRTRIFQLQP